MKARQKRQSRRKVRGARSRRLSPQRDGTLEELLRALLARLLGDTAGGERLQQPDPLLFVRWDRGISRTGLSHPLPGGCTCVSESSEGIAPAEAMESANWAPQGVLAVVPLKLSPQISIDYVFFSPGGFSSA